MDLDELLYDELYGEESFFRLRHCEYYTQVLEIYITVVGLT